MKKYLFLAVAALGLAACAEKDINGPEHNGELEQSYVAVTIAADNMSTKAGDESTGSTDYADGTTDERKITSAHVLFFDDKGDPFPVTSESYNYVNVYNEFEGKDPAGDNVSDIQNAVLVINNRKGEHPTKMIAVLNWVPSKNYSISELQTTLSDLTTTHGFIMSNAVFAQNEEEMSASIITPENIAEKAELAIANPVKVYVERLAAKVTFNAEQNGLFEVGSVNNKNGDENKVYAQIEGWELYQDYSQSTLVKDINPKWSDLGFVWNNPDLSRSYWTLSTEAEKGAYASDSFKWNPTNGVDIALRGHFYCGENTAQVVKTGDVITKDPRTKVIIKAQLKQKDAEGNYAAVELARWHSTDYVGDNALKTAVVNTLKYSIYSGVTTSESTVYTPLQPDDITIVEADEATNVADIKAFEVFFKLSTTGAAKKWYQYENGEYNEAAVEVIDARLANVQPALKYQNGQTYYYTEIKHLGGNFGVVRNHIYQFNITDINGYGTPVFDGETVIKTPERPVDVATYVAAEINVLSWRVVEQNDTLE